MISDNNDDDKVLGGFGKRRKVPSPSSVFYDHSPKPEPENKFEFNSSPYFQLSSPFMVPLSVSKSNDTGTAVSNSEDKVAATALINLIHPAASPVGSGIKFRSDTMEAAASLSGVSINSIGACSMFESMIRGSHVRGVATPTLDFLAEAAMSSSSSSLSS